jgi:hypothetical protein
MSARANVAFGTRSSIFMSGPNGLSHSSDSGGRFLTEQELATSAQQRPLTCTAINNIFKWSSSLISCHFRQQSLDAFDFETAEFRYGGPLLDTFNIRSGFWRHFHPPELVLAGCLKLGAERVVASFYGYRHLAHPRLVRWDSSSDRLQLPPN